MWTSECSCFPQAENLSCGFSSSFFSGISAVPWILFSLQRNWLQNVWLKIDISENTSVKTLWESCYPDKSVTCADFLLSNFPSACLAERLRSVFYSNNTEQGWQLHRPFQGIQLRQEKKKLWRWNISKAKSKAAIFHGISWNWSLNRLIMEINNCRSLS